MLSQGLKWGLFIRIWTRNFVYIARWHDQQMPALLVSVCPPRLVGQIMTSWCRHELNMSSNKVNKISSSQQRYFKICLIFIGLKKLAQPRPHWMALLHSSIAIFKVIFIKVIIMIRSLQFGIITIFLQKFIKVQTFSYTGKIYDKFDFIDMYDFSW